MVEGKRARRNEIKERVESRIYWKGESRKAE